MIYSNDQPPAYEAAMMTQAHTHGPYVPAGSTDAKVVKVPPQQPQAFSPPMGASPFHGPSMPPTTVYNYRHPQSGEIISSLLPPDHPQMICLQQGHIPHSKFGILGIVAAVFWFPLGVGLCLLDRRVQCTRCGHVIEEGMCG
ncbi:hypothetical protein BC835DRAFT_1338752 [Cytidiella melzeri]|nr:hypothetical protein BC835DRAFT_1338752 [Cytidiella melzeri]